MAEIVFRLPSKAVQYGYVEIRSDENELGLDVTGPYELGEWYAKAVNLFWQGEAAGAQVDVSPPEVTDQYEKSPEYKVGDKVSVGGIEFTKIAESPFEEVTNEEAVALVKEGLGATEIHEEAPPWARKVTPQAKPWESKEEAPKAPAGKSKFNFK